MDRSRLERGPAPAPLTLNAAVSTLCDVALRRRASVLPGLPLQSFLPYGIPRLDLQ